MDTNTKRQWTTKITKHYSKRFKNVKVIFGTLPLLFDCLSGLIRHIPPVGA